MYGEFSNSHTDFPWPCLITRCTVSIVSFDKFGMAIVSYCICQFKKLGQTVACQTALLRRDFPQLPWVVNPYGSLQGYGRGDVVDSRCSVIPSSYY